MTGVQTCALPIFNLFPSHDMFGSSNRTTTAFRCNDEIVRVKCGCFYGDLDEFKKQIEETHGDNKYARQYLAMIELIKAKFEL